MGKHKDPFKVLKDTMVTFNEEFAGEYMSMPTYKHERGINLLNVDHWKEVMRSGLWETGQGEITIAYCRWDKKYRRLNGQHRCLARRELDDPEFTPKIRCVVYSIASEAEYRKAYANRDSSDVVNTRKRGQIVTMLLSDQFDEKLATSLFPRLEGGYRAAKYGMTGSHRKRAREVCDEMADDKDLVVKAAAIMSRSESSCEATKHMRRQSVRAAIFKTVKHRPRVAHRFWTAIIDETWSGLKDPAKVLHRYLRTTDCGNSKTNKTATPDEMHNVCIRCFNAYHAGRELSKAPTGSGATPEVR